MMTKTREETEALIKDWCEKNKYEFVESTGVGSYVIISITGDNCSKAFNEFLQAQQFEYTKPLPGILGIETYIKIRA